MVSRRSARSRVLKFSSLRNVRIAVTAKVSWVRTSSARFTVTRRCSASRFSTSKIRRTEALRRVGGVRVVAVAEQRAAEVAEKGMNVTVCAR